MRMHPEDEFRGAIVSIENLKPMYGKLPLLPKYVYPQLVIGEIRCTLKILLINCAVYLLALSTSLVPASGSDHNGFSLNYVLVSNKAGCRYSSLCLFRWATNCASSGHTSITNALQRGLCSMD